MPSLRLLENKHLLSHGELEELLLVFLEYLEEVPTDLDRELSVTCVERVECLLQTKSGEDGIDESMLSRRDSLSSQLWLDLLFPLWSWPEDIESREFRRSPLSSTTLLLITLLRPRMPLLS